jgi:hypothetical protein
MLPTKLAQNRSNSSGIIFLIYDAQFAPSMSQIAPAFSAPLHLIDANKVP